jgi:hypothetical protein
MAANSEEIVQQIRADFESLLQWVMGTTPLTPTTAHDMECAVLRRVLEMGRRLLLLFFVAQAQRQRPASVRNAKGETLPYHSQAGRTYGSIFGAIEFERAYYYRVGAGICPVDAALNLPAHREGDLLRQWRERLGTKQTYEQADAWLGELLGGGLPRSTRALKDAIAEDAELVGSFYEKAPAPVPVAEASILVAQADGKGIPLRKPTEAAQKVRLGKGQKRGCKKEAVVTGVYTIAPNVRTPESVLASLFADTQPQATPTTPRGGPCNKRLEATLSGKESACVSLAEGVRSQEGEHIRDRVALTDGSEALQTQVLGALPGFTLVLDVIHAIEYLWKAANALLGETHPKREMWVKRCVQEMLGGQVPRLMGALRALAEEAGRSGSQQEVLLKVAAYYERNQEYMHYDRYLAAGWPIATGVIEGACRHLVKDRFELSGMRWSQSGAQALLQLRCVEENGDWEAFHAYRRGERLRTLYGVQPSQEGGVTLERAGGQFQAIGCLAA